jgi:D-arabinose 1-dehydrogenase-like Zn-dependent alcohol dehydrogenase
MKAAVLRQFGRPLELSDVRVPEPAPDEALVRVVATGICGTDLKITGGDFSTTTPLPIIPGHEVAGELVSEVDGIQAGQRVACYLYDPCGSCRWCRAGEFTLCPNSKRLGFERDGGLAEFITVPRRNLLPFSERVAFEAAAVCMDAVTSPWRALITRARLQAGETIVIAGAGGLGLSAIQIARSVGARAAAVDPVASHRELAIAEGAEATADPNDLSPIRAWASDGADVGFEASGRREGFDALVACLRAGGRLVSCGYRPGIEYGLDSGRLVLSEITIMGSRAGTREDARAALKAIEGGVIKPEIMERLVLEDANRGLELLRSGKVLGRVVVVQ